MFDNEAIEESKKKKEELQNMYLHALAQRKKNTKIKTEINWEQKYEEEKRMRKTIQKRLQQVERKRNDMSETKKRFQASITQERKKQRHLQTSVKQTSEQLERLKEEMKQIEKRYAKELLLLKEQAKEKQVLAHQQLQSELHTSRSHRAALQQKYEQMKQELNQYKQKAYATKLIERIEKQPTQQHEVKRLRQTIQELNQRIQSYKDIHTPSNLLHALRHTITIDNVFEFVTNNKNQLTELAKKIDRLLIEKRDKRLDKKAMSRKLWQDPSESNVKLGYF